MTTSENITELAAALAKAQGELQNVVKDAKNPHFKSDYATLDAITDTVRPVFAKHGLAIVQIPTFRDGFRDGACVVETLITHSSGQWIRGESSAPVAKADAQGVGSATTYLRRYATAGIAALAQTDDDGNAASAKAKPEVKAAVAPTGYDDWLEDLASVADNGAEALKDAWTKSRSDYRRHLTTTNNAAWESLKQRAGKVQQTVPA